MSYAVGSLVKARGREWVVLPESTDDLVMLRPLGGTDDEIAGIYAPLERIEPARFDLPAPDRLGDFRSCRLLRDAVRLGFRASAGPFRSFARIAVEPRPYQLVPLLMALKLDPVRILIADDVGIGKTIEACLIARELLDRGEVRRLAVLCPPQLAEQWQGELSDKFHIDAELVLPSTATRLEAQCRLGESVFEVFPHTVVSSDFIKSDRRRDDFLRAAPELIIVDEAHTFSFAEEGRGGRMQRHQLLTGLARRADRNLVLVTATPDSGKEGALHSLLRFLNPEFPDLPQDLSGRENEPHRRQLAAHFVQRRRADIRHYIQSDTPFPEREEAEETYKLCPEYRQLFSRVLNYARETVRDATGGRQRQRVRWWSALSLLRSLASSPAAAAATLRARSSTADAESEDAVDEIGRHAILDVTEDEPAEGADSAPGCDIGELAADEQSNRRRLLEMARVADSLRGEKDEKLLKAAKLIKELIADGYRPIVFCRFIPTAEYVAEQLRERLPKGVEVVAVTGLLPPAERAERIIQLAQADKRVLVCTDCLSEGINLQEHFDAVFHYDLSWNPTRHEQREGRVDRFLQPRALLPPPQNKVRVLTYYGTDNQIDGIVLDVLLRKHKAIRKRTGVSVPVPSNYDQVVEAIFEGLLLRESASAGTSQQLLPGFEEYLKPQREALYTRWDSDADREKRSRTLFAQETLEKHAAEVARELDAMRAAIGSGAPVREFVLESLSAHGAVVSGADPMRFQLDECPRALREAIGDRKSFAARFDLPVREDEACLTRTHPIVEGLASYVMTTALDPLGQGPAARCGVIRTGRVPRRTTLLLLRLRFHIITRRGDDEYPLLAEDCQIVAFTGAPTNAVWLAPADAEALLDLAPEQNVAPDVATHQLQRILDEFEPLRPQLNDIASHRGQELLEAHQRVRAAAQMRGVQYRVEPNLPPDVLGVYLYLP